jgi:hypothetical protein
MRKLRLIPAGVLAAVTGLLALLAVATVTVAHATRRVRADACAPTRSQRYFREPEHWGSLRGHG